MNFARIVALLTIVTVLAGTGAGAAKEPSWGKVKADFLQAFHSVKPKERMQAIYDHLEGQDRPELVKLLAKIVLADAKQPAMVVDAAVTVLGDLKNEEAVDEVIRLSGKGPDMLRMRLFEVLGRCGGGAAVDYLTTIVTEKSLSLRIAAVSALGATKSPAVITVLAGTLGAPEWPLRVASAEAMSTTGSAASVPYLILQLGKESGRVREDLRDALSLLTKTRCGISFNAWLQWYQRKHKGLEFDRREIVADPVRPTVVYHGIPTWSRSVVFVFDVSKSMMEEARIDFNASIPKVIRAAGGPELERWKAMKTKIEWSRALLIHAIQTMAPGVQFGMVAYNHGPSPIFSGRLVPATPENRKKAITRIAGLSPSGDTDLHAALLRALRIPEGKEELGPKNMIDGPGTIYFMTDGVSTSGVIREGHRILEEMERINALRRVRFNCLGIGMHDGELLEGLARASGGTYHGVE
jgi:von Willebrand factor type A domain/HEAT repeats